ncbi:MAG: hypothetical protein IKJ18_02140 [Bacteroidaceae bacterium]|nr:hypothetical protein [Bacteroidaceae bacterium]
MNLLKKNLFVLAMVCLALPAFSQVTVNASIDSLQLLIGEQARVRVEVSCPSDGNLIMPTYPNNMLMEGIEIVGEVKADTQYLNKKSHMVVTQTYAVTSFDTAFYYIPPFEVLVDSVSYASNPLALKVLTYDVDTTNVEAIFPIKDVMERPMTFVELLPMLLAVVMVIAFIFLIPFLLGRYHDNKPILRRVTIAPKLPPHQVALQEMERIKSEKNWLKDDVKQYYTELTDALRVYMEERFGFNAMEMTSDDIIAQLNEQPDKEWIGELRELFAMSDLVKFAKYKPLINENDMNNINAIDFINKTKVEAVTPAEPVVQEVVVKEGRSRQAKILFITGIVLLGVLGVVALYVAITEVIQLFF